MPGGVVVTDSVALTPSNVPRVHPKLAVNPLMRSAVATAAPSLPACTESLVPTAEPPARPRTHTWYVPAVTNRTRKSSRGLPVTKPVSTAVPLSGV